MNQKQLSYFLAIAEEGNITKAAERLHIPQPHLSNQLKNMEIELGAKLAVRNHKPSIDGRRQPFTVSCSSDSRAYGLDYQGTGRV